MYLMLHAAQCRRRYLHARAYVCTYLQTQDPISISTIFAFSVIFRIFLFGADTAVARTPLAHHKHTDPHNKYSSITVDAWPECYCAAKEKQAVECGSVARAYVRGYGHNLPLKVNLWKPPKRSPRSHNIPRTINHNEASLLPRLVRWIASFEHFSPARENIPRRSILSLCRSSPISNRSSAGGYLRLANARTTCRKKPTVCTAPPQVQNYVPPAHRRTTPTTHSSSFSNHLHLLPSCKHEVPVLLLSAGARGRCSGPGRTQGENQNTIARSNHACASPSRVQGRRV